MTQNMCITNMVTFKLNYCVFIMFLLGNIINALKQYVNCQQSLVLINVL